MRSEDMQNATVLSGTGSSTGGAAAAMPHMTTPAGYAVPGYTPGVGYGAHSAYPPGYGATTDPFAGATGTEGASSAAGGASEKK